MKARRLVWVQDGPDHELRCGGITLGALVWMHKQRYVAIGFDLQDRPKYKTLARGKRTIERSVANLRIALTSAARRAPVDGGSL